MDFVKIRKADLVNAVYERTGFDKQAVQGIADSLLEEISRALQDGSTIELRGFGTFEPRLRKGREAARNPKTGEKCSVESHYVAVFRPGRELRLNMLKLKAPKLDINGNMKV